MALASAAQRVAAELEPERFAVDRQNAAEIRLHEGAHGPAAERIGELSRSSSDARLEAESLRARTSAYGTLDDGTGSGVLQRREYVRLLHEARADVVHARVVRFAHKTVDAHDGFVFFILKRPIDEAVDRRGNAHRVRQDDRRFEVAELLDLRIARHLPEAVPEKNAAGDLRLKNVARMRANGRDAGVHADAVVVQSHVPDEDAFDVRNGVVFARREDADSDAVFTSALSAVRRERGIHAQSFWLSGVLVYPLGVSARIVVLRSSFSPSALMPETIKKRILASERQSSAAHRNRYVRSIRDRCLVANLGPFHPGHANRRALPIGASIRPCESEWSRGSPETRGKEETSRPSLKWR